MRADEVDRYELKKQEFFEKKKRRVMRNRMIIVGIGAALVLLIVLIIILIVNVAKGASDQQQTLETVSSQPADATVEAVTEAPTEDLLSINTYISADVEDDGTDGVYDASQYVWHKQAFSLFYGDQSTAERYAQTMNTAAETFGANVKTYSLIAPLHTEFGLPERLRVGENAIDNYSAAEYLKNSYTAMNSSVIPVNPYNMLSSHCDEYIYFNSDHHWTGLGAYYAYSAFAQTAGLPVLNLSDCTEHKIDGFNGTLTKVVSAELDSDSVYYWTFPYDVTDTVTEESGDTYEYDSCYYEFAEPGDNTYGVFLMGDKPLEVIRSSSDASNGEKIVVIHESYGNAFIPYLTYNYDEVYSVDFRYFTGDLSDFCEENGITNVLFLNNVMSSATLTVLETIEGLL